MQDGLPPGQMLGRGDREEGQGPLLRQRAGPTRCRSNVLGRGAVEVVQGHDDEEDPGAGPSSVHQLQDSLDPALRLYVLGGRVPYGQRQQIADALGVGLPLAGRWPGLN
eukprot:1843308-Lingulodinium_polyedra.AAC.1